MRTLTGVGKVLILAWLGLGSNPARAQSGEPGGLAEASLPDVNQRHFGILASVGTFQGMAGGVRVGSAAGGVQGSFGWAPTLQRIVEDDADASGKLRWFTGTMISGDAYFRAVTGKTGGAGGVLLGYRYFSVLGHGMALGGYGQLRLHRVLEGFVNVGGIFYPNGEDKLRRDEDIPRDADFDWPGPTFSTHFNLGLIVFP